MEKLLIISDTHLTKKFDENKFNYLKNLFSKYDQIIINGDFWSNYSCSFEEFVNSKWNQLFPILREKTIYVYGNHDREEWCDSRTTLFSYKQAEKIKLQVFEQNLAVEHGHLCTFDSFTNPRFIKWHRKLNIDKYNYGLQSVISNMFGKHLYNKFGKSQEKKFVKKANNLVKDEVLVVGHSHSPNHIKDKNYINTGYISYGNAYFVEVDKEGIKLVHENY